MSHGHSSSIGVDDGLARSIARAARSSSRVRAGQGGGRSYRAASIATFLLAAVAAFVLGHDAAVHAAASADADLIRLLRFMAVIKALMALVALWLVDWRLRLVASPRLATTYIVALATMAAGPGLIWSMTHIIAGAILFHSGLLVLLGLGLVDGAGFVPARAWLRHATRSAR